MQISAAHTVAIAMTLLFGKGDGELGGGGDPEGVVDSDGDTIDDNNDLCPGSDDRVDLDASGKADCAETIGPNLMFDDPSSLNLVVAGGNTTHYHVTMDRFGWGGSGALWSEANINVGSNVSLCVEIPHYVDEIEIWFNARTVWTPNEWVYGRVEEYANSGCVGSATAATSGNNMGGLGVGWGTYDRAVPLRSDTRSVWVDFNASTGDPWVIDNIAFMGILHSEGSGGEPGMN